MQGTGILTNFLPRIKGNNAELFNFKTVSACLKED